MLPHINIQVKTKETDICLYVAKEHKLLLAYYSAKNYKFFLSFYVFFIYGNNEKSKLVTTINIILNNMDLIGADNFLIYNTILKYDFLEIVDENIFFKGKHCAP